LTKILDYIPNLIGALAILTVGLIIAQLVYEAIDGAAKASGIRIYSIAAVIAKWSLIVITFLVILEQIGIQTTILQVFAGSLGLMLALAGGLAFGLGGQYQAKELLEEIKGKVSGRK
jgi:small-conductance mechanosensitive channel